MIPAELRALPQWVVWKREVRGGKPTKIPHQVDGSLASSTDPSTWASFEEAVRAAPRFNGIGFVFSPDDPYVGIDFDDCRLGGHLHPIVAATIAQLDSFTEISPSGKGLHVLVRADLNGHLNRTSKTPWGGSFEVYSQDRYFTISGQHHEGTPGTVEERQAPLDKILSNLLPAPQPVSVLAPANLGPMALDDEELLEKARRAKNGAKFSALFDRGERSGYPSQSEADLALVDEIAFYCGADPERIDQWFRRSKLYRSKWDRRDYRNATIRKVLQTRTDYYRPRAELTVVAEPEQDSTVWTPDGKPAGKLDPGHFFDDDRGLVVSRLGQEIKDAGHLRVAHDGLLYRYCSGVYQPDGKTFVKVRCKVLLKDRFKRRHQEEVMTWLQADFPSIPEHPDTRVINCSNGLLDWHTKELSPHTPEYPSLIQVPVAWDSYAVCPVIDRFIKEVVPDDAELFIYELIAYLLFAGNPFRKAVLLLGPGRNGKTVLLNLIRALLGAKNCASVTLQSFGEHRFAPAQLFGKLANIAGDLDARAIKRTDTFKMATGNDAVMAEHKYGQPFSFVPYAVPLFSANEAPISADQTDAWFDRWLIVPFERRFSEDEADPKLIDKITIPKELSGLLVRSVAALHRLMERGRFEIPESVRAAGDVYRSKLDTVRAFIEDECVFDMNASSNRTILYKDYSEWCKDGGRWPVSDSNFFDHVRRNWPGQIEEAKSDGKRMIRGLRKQVLVR